MYKQSSPTVRDEKKAGQDQDENQVVRGRCIALSSNGWRVTNTTAGTNAWSKRADPLGWIPDLSLPGSIAMDWAAVLG
jgi:hypothetical protein